MKQKINEEWKLYAGNVEIFVTKDIVKGRLDIMPKKGTNFSFIGSEPHMIKIIGQLLIEASEI